MSELLAKPVDYPQRLRALEFIDSVLRSDELLKDSPRTVLARSCLGDILDDLLPLLYQNQAPERQDHILQVCCLQGPLSSFPLRL